MNQPFAKLIADNDDEFDPHDWLAPLNQRVAVRMLGLDAAALLTGCGGSGSLSSGSSSSISGTTATATTMEVSVTGNNYRRYRHSYCDRIALFRDRTFYNDSSSLGTATLSGGSTSLATSFSGSGTQTLEAVYAGSTTAGYSATAKVYLPIITT